MSDRRFNGMTGLIGRATPERARSAALAAAALVTLAACQGVIGEPPTGFGSPGSNVNPSGGDPGSGGSAGSPGSGGSPASGGTTGPGGTGGAPADGGIGPSATLQARIRRLTNAEYDASVKALLGIDSKFGATFTPDARQDGFTRNDAQRVDPVFTMQIDDAATQLAAQTRGKFGTLAPCANPTSGGEACAATFIGAFLTRAYRRPTAQRELDALMAVYRAGAEASAYADGIEAVIHAVLVSPAFLYTTEIGGAVAPAGATAMTITAHEAASAMAYLLTGAPPDDALLATAASGELMKSDVRQAEARRLFASAGASAQITRIVEEWLGIDRITETAKDSNAYPAFAGLKDAMKREADAFVNEVMWKTSHDVADLLSADWTLLGNDVNLAQMYGATVDPAHAGRYSFGAVPRRGVLNQGAFLSVYAHATESGPVLRGVAMVRRLACIEMASPTELNIQVVPPVPDPTKTTRERFSVHATDPVCATCHGKIDGFGFAFENFDGMGKARLTEGTGASLKNVNSATSVAVGMDFDGAYADSSAMVAKMATSQSVRACFARHLFRASAANSELANRQVEDSFLAAWSALAPDKQSNILEVLVAWLGSDTFVQRRTQP
ncbi:MAG TPA: DUF1592 domain-containing protein [Polyangiaceae bacterium]|nr:DUF1592 domain-containing protein [Polyangiaceae bacterium]